MSITITLHAWWVLAYIGVGLVLFWPLNALAVRSIVSPRRSTWAWAKDSWQRGARNFLVRAAVQVVAWPAALWEVLEGPIRRARKQR